MRTDSHALQLYAVPSSSLAVESCTKHKRGLLIGSRRQWIPTAPCLSSPHTNIRCFHCRPYQIVTTFLCNVSRNAGKEWSVCTAIHNLLEADWQSGQSVSLSEPLWGSRNSTSPFFNGNFFFHLVRRPLWREDGTVICSRVYSDQGQGVRIEVFTAVTMKNAVFWDVTPYGPCKNRRFGGTWSLSH
jgi:hypothetical protein